MFQLKFFNQPLYFLNFDISKLLDKFFVNIVNQFQVFYFILTSRFYLNIPVIFLHFLLIFRF